MELYLSGPMTGLPEFNYPFFRAVAKELRGMGYRVQNPAELSLPPDAPYEVCLRAALQQLLNHSTGIVSLPDWKRSTGACIEHLNAYFAGMPRFVYVGVGQPLVATPITLEEWDTVQLRLVSRLGERKGVEAT